LELAQGTADRIVDQGTRLVGQPYVALSVRIKRIGGRNRQHDYRRHRIADVIKMLAPTITVEPI
jgi:hypothetical protein